MSVKQRLQSVDSLGRTCVDQLKRSLTSLTLESTGANYKKLDNGDRVRMAFGVERVVSCWWLRLELLGAHRVGLVSKFYRGGAAWQVCQC